MTGTRSVVTIASVMEDDELRSSRYWNNLTYEDRRSQANIPKRYRDCTLDNFEGDDTVAKARAILDKWSPADWVVITGPVGAGKTHLAVAMLKERLRKEMGFFTSAPYLVEMLDDSMKHDGVLPSIYRNPHTLKYLRKQWPIMVLDDLGTERESEFVIREITALVARRWDEEIGLIVTTSLSKAFLEKRYPAKLVRLLFDAHRVTVKERPSSAR